jgi:ABC-type sugar transport system permease subunit
MRRRMIVACLAPALVVYLASLVVPAIQALYLSLLQTSGFNDQAQWVGMRNYAALLKDSVFWLSVTNMLTILLIGGAAVFGCAFLFTMLLTSGIWGKRLFRALIFMPNIISVVGLATFWSFVFTPKYGFLSSLLKMVGLEQLSSVAFTAPEHVFWSMLVGVVWIFAGFFTVLILSGADKIPTEMFDAARLEGASNRQIFRFVTVPMIWDVVLITLVLWAIEAIRMMEFPYAFGGPNIDQNLYTPAIYLFIMGFGQRQPVYQLGYASAIGVSMFLFTAIIVLVLGLIFRRERVEF